MRNQFVSEKSLRVNAIINNVMICLCLLAITACVWNIFTEVSPQESFVAFIFFSLCACFFAIALKEPSLKARK